MTLQDIEEGMRKVAEMSSGPVFAAICANVHDPEGPGQAGVFPESERARMGEPGIWSVCKCGPDTCDQSKNDALALSWLINNAPELLRLAKERLEERT